MKRIAYILLLALVSLSASAALKESYYYQRAEQAYQQKNYEECLRYAEKGVQEDKKDGLCWALMAEIYSKRDFARYAEALEASEKAMPLVKKDRFWLSLLYGIRGDVYYKIGEMQLSADNYSRSLAINPDNLQVQASLADVLHELKKYKESAELYTKLLANNPQYVYLNAELADNYLAMGDTATAERYLHFCNSITGGENIRTHLLLSDIALGRGQWPLACNEMAKAMFAEGGYDMACDSLSKLCPELLDAAMLNELEAKPNDVQALNTMGLYHYQNDHFVESAYYTHRAAAASEQPDQFSSLLFGIYRHINSEEAIQYLRVVMKEDSSASAIYDAMGSELSKLNRKEEALAAARRACQLDPADGDNFRMLGRRYIEMNMLDQALAAMDTAVMLADTGRIATAIFNRAEVLRLQGKEAEAKAQLEEALTLVATDPDRVGTAVYIHALLGHRDEVEHYADSISAQNRFMGEADLVQVYACMRDKEKVLAHMERYRALGGRESGYLRHYFRLAWLSEDPDFLKLIDLIDADRLADLDRLNKMLVPEEKTTGTTEIPFTRQGGVCQVKCAINGLPLYFVFDTGASDVSISSVEANFMLKNGYLTESDFLGKQNFVSATGEIHEGTIINLREVRVGEIVLKDVKASVVKSQHAPLLLGQTVFRRFGTLEVDNEQNVIRFK